MMNNIGNCFVRLSITAQQNDLKATINSLLKHCFDAFDPRRITVGESIVKNQGQTTVMATPQHIRHGKTHGSGQLFAHPSAQLREVVDPSSLAQLQAVKAVGLFKVKRRLLASPLRTGFSMAFTAWLKGWL